MQERFIFDSGDSHVEGRLFRPAGKPIAAAVLTGPATSVKEQVVQAYALALSGVGFVALTFDHRHFGESGGEPRQLENPQAKAEDIQAAVDALSRCLQVADIPMVGVGVCAGAGYMAHAVANSAAFSGFVGVAGYYAQATPESIAAAQPKLARARKAQQQWQSTGVAEMIPAVAEQAGDVAMPLREAFEYYGTSRGAVPGYVNSYAVQSFAHTSCFDTMEIARSIDVPALLVHSEKALAPALARKFADKLHGPRQIRWLQSTGQIDFYDDARLVGEATRLIEEFVTDLPAREG